MGRLLSPLPVLNAIAKRLTDCNINVETAVAQSLFLSLDDANSSFGVAASVAELVYLAEDLVRTV